LQLRLVVAAAMLLVPGAARAEGELAMRTQYYKERSTRVAQPMLDAKFITDDVEVRGHMLIDAITSASPASGATGQPFTEYRWEVGGGFTRALGNWRAGTDLRFSYEPDYRSIFLTGRGELDLASRNTTLGLLAGYGNDALSNAGAQGGISERIEGTLNTVLASASLTQVLTPTMLAGLTYDLAYLEGFQENPYRTVAAGGLIEMERLPRKRYRHAVAGTVRSILPRTGTTGAASYRLYADSWGIVAHSPELRVIQAVRGDVDVHVRWRYHKQSQAEFYKDVYDTGDPEMQPFLTDDVKLSNYDTHTIGFKVDAPLTALGICSRQTRDMRVDVVGEYVVQNNRYGDAFVAGLGLTIPMKR
jgi:hypothetical protein